MAVLLLFTIALPLSANTAFATTNISDTNSSQINPSNDQNSANITDQNSKEVTNTNASTQTAAPATTKQTGKTALVTTAQANTKEYSSSKNIAAGSTQSATTVNPQVSFTSAQINDAASRIKSFVETNHRLPGYVTINNYQVSMPQFLQLSAENLLNINNGLKVSVNLKTVTSPSSPTETVKSGNILQTEYLSLAQSVKSVIDSTGSAPNYINSSLGQIKFESLIYTFSKILNFQATNQRLPSYVSVSPWTAGSSSSSEGSGSNSSSTVPASLQPYLVPTANCQSTDPAITSLAASITSGLTSTYDKAAAIFNWVRDHVTYSYYYNTQKGALGTLSSRTANCCDTSHLVVALARAAGIPARYQLGTCTFSDGTFGHVWAQLYVDGKWYYADAISKKNTFGVINNWNLNTYTLRGTYASLPF